MNVLLWILIGLAAGLAVVALAPNLRPRSVSNPARRRIGALAAGSIGAVAGGYALVLSNPSLRADRLTTALASLAGALWLAGIVEVYSSRRRRGEDSGGSQGRIAEPGDSPVAITMPAV